MVNKHAREADRQEAVRMYSTGDVSVDQIAEELDVSSSTVYRWLKDAGAMATTTDERDDAIVREYTENFDKSVVQIQVEYGVSSAQLYRILARKGISTPRKQYRDTEGKREKVIELAEAGLGIAAIRDEVHKSYEWVRDVLNESGIQWKHR
jgi:transposase-like protein